MLGGLDVIVLANVLMAELEVIDAGLLIELDVAIGTLIVPESEVGTIELICAIESVLVVGGIKLVIEEDCVVDSIDAAVEIDFVSSNKA